MTNLSMRLQAAMAQDEKLWKQIRLLQATEEFEAALRRYASLMDEINGREDGETLKLIVKVLKEDVGLPIHNIPSEFHTSRNFQKGNQKTEQAKLPHIKNHRQTNPRPSASVGME